MEYHEMMLYASKSVILSVKVFIENPSRENFLQTIICMRKDLNVNKNDISVNEIKLQRSKKP